jgi:hypothetical protein
MPFGPGAEPPDEAGGAWWGSVPVPLDPHAFAGETVDVEAPDLRTVEARHRAEWPQRERPTEHERGPDWPPREAPRECGACMWVSRSPSRVWSEGRGEGSRTPTDWARVSKTLISRLERGQGCGPPCGCRKHPTISRWGEGGGQGGGVRVEGDVARVSGGDASPLLALG